MYEHANTGGNCMEHQTYEDIMARGGINEGLMGCGSNMAIPFFLSYQVIAGWLILNLIIAAIIDGLSNATADRE